MSMKTGFYGYKGFDDKGNCKVVGKETNSFYHTDGVKPMPCTDITINSTKSKAEPRDISGFLERMKRKYKIK